MSDEIRWITVSDRHIQPRLQMPEPTLIVCVAVVDVLAALDRPDGPDALRSSLELLLAHLEEKLA